MAVHFALICTPKMPDSTVKRNNGSSPQCLAGNAIFTTEERAALALTEAVTLMTSSVSDEIYDEVSCYFTG